MSRSREQPQIVTFEWRDLIRRSPPWALSLIFHLLLIGLIGGYISTRPPIRTPADSPILGIEMIEDDPGQARRQEVEVAQKPEERQTKPDSDRPSNHGPIGLAGSGQGRRARSTSRRLLGALDKVERLQAKRVAVYSQRTARGRKDAVARFGGSGATESAVERGLAWLARHQDADGRWDSNGYLEHCPSRQDCREQGESGGFAGYDVAQTGLALLSFMGVGYHHQGGQYRGTIKRGLAFLLEAQQADGAFRLEACYGSKFFYSQAIATFALAEAYGLTRDPRLRNRIRSAVRFIEKHQNLAGGWSYKPPAGLERNDSSVTGWVVMALKSARLVGVHVSEGTLVGAIGHFKRLTTPDGMLAYTDTLPRQHVGTNSITAVGLLSRLLLGQPQSAKVVKLAAQLMTQDPPKGSLWQERDQCLYYWYYGTLAAFLIGGETWSTWNTALKSSLLGLQIDQGHGRGSWPARSMWARQGGGRIYATAMALLCLQIYYKYVPQLLRNRTSSLSRHWLTQTGKAGLRQAGDWKQEVKKLYSQGHAAK